MQSHTDYHRLFGQMCEFRRRPALVFTLPNNVGNYGGRLAATSAPVELVVPNLEAFFVPDGDLERIQSAVNAAQTPE